MKFFASALLLISAGVVSCNRYYHLSVPADNSSSITGSAFYKAAAAMNWKQRDSFAVQEILSGHIPSFLKKFVPVTVIRNDSASGKEIRIIYYVSPDYLSVGTAEDWARIPLTPMAAQKIADSFHCFLPTAKMADDIYKAAVVKPEPVPLFAFRDSTPVMYHHHLIIEGQRKGKKGLIAGIKKDVVLSNKVITDARPNRVAIYGWHKPDGKPIQPLYTGHINWYVDYSHGIRLVYRKIKVNGKWMDYMNVFKDEKLRKLVCNEPDFNFLRYQPN